MKESAFKAIIADNEHCIAKAIADGRNIEAYLLFHALFESLLRIFLKVTDDNVRFVELIHRYKEYLKSQGQSDPKFVDELIKFNQRRNRIMHQLWRKGYTVTNKTAEKAVVGANLVYGLFVEWLVTFAPEIGEAGFVND